MRSSLRDSCYLEARLPFDTRQLRRAHCAAELAVSRAAACEEADSGAAGELELCADDRMNPCRLRGLDQLDRSVEAVSIAETERGDAELGGRLDHALRRSGPLKEGVVRAGGEFGEPVHRRGVAA